MKMTVQRTLFEIVNFLLAFLFVIPLGILFEQLCGYPLFRCCLVPCLSALGFILGRYSRSRELPVSIALCIIGFVVAVLGAVFLTPAKLLITLLITLLTGFFSVFFFFTARKAGYTIYAPMSITGIICHIFVLICCTGFNWPEQVSTAAGAAAIGFFLLSLFSFSAKGLRKSLHKNDGEKHVSYPAGMQMGNFLLVTGFIIIAAFISNIYPIFNAFSGVFVFVIKAIAKGFGFFSGLFDRRGVGTDVDEGVSEKVAEDSILNAEPKGEAAWVTTSVEIFAFILVLLLVFYALFRLMQKLRAAGVRMPSFLRNLRDRFAPVKDEDYTDETESLFDAKKMLSDTGARLRNALKKMRERPQRMDDFPDDRMKIRFVFQQLLKKVKTRDPGAAVRTPNEIFAREYPGEADFREFMDCYNIARYSSGELPEDAVDCARAILKQKM